MSGAHQGDCNPALDVSKRLRVGLTPPGGQATGDPFQGIRRLHPQQPVHQGDKGGEVLTFLEASLQIDLLLPLFRLDDAAIFPSTTGRQCLRHGCREHCRSLVTRGPGL